MTRPLPAKTEEPRYVFQDVRCNFCHTLFFRADIGSIGVLQVWCRKCRRMAVVELPVVKYT